MALRRNLTHFVTKQPWRCIALARLALLQNNLRPATPGIATLQNNLSDALLGPALPRLQKRLQLFRDRFVPHLYLAPPAERAATPAQLDIDILWREQAESPNTN